MTNEDQNEREGECLGGDAERNSVGNLDQAIDTLAALLRDFGVEAFDLPKRSAQTLERLCEQWANHVLFAAAPPDDSESAEAASGGRRDWNALRIFFAEQRHAESNYVTAALTGMRQVLWTCVNEMRQSVLNSTQADDRMQSQMDRLQQIVETADPAEIRREVLSVVSTVNQLLEQEKEQNRLRMEAMHAHIRQLDSLLAEARKESSLDALTQLFNRRAFTEQLTRTLERGAVFEEASSLFLVDADHFKSVNDTYGHPAGDSVLRTLADCLARAFPSSNDCVARYGGEEFAIICQEMTLDEAERKAERLLRAVRELSIPNQGTPIRITISIGLAESRPGENAAAWIERADQALYKAKQNGRNRVHVAC